MDPIAKDLLLSDTQLGFISGISFALFYAALGIPIARLADRYIRVNIIAISLALWSFMTVICGLAANFWQLIFSRILVGVGEAGSTPTAHSVISDYFSRADRASAISIYMAAIPFGTLLGFLVGGWINELYGWRVSFIALGIPGLILALVVKYTIREPVRGQYDTLGTTSTQAEEEKHFSLSDTLFYLWRNQSFRYLVQAMTLTTFVLSGIGQWVPTFFIRTHGMNTGELGIWLAILVGVFGSTGIFLGGYLARRVASDNEPLQMRAIAMGTMFMMVPGVTSLLWPDKHIALMLSGVVSFFCFLSTGPSFALIMGLTPPHIRATASTIVLLILNLIGAGLGPQAIGFLSDILSIYFGGNSLRISLVIVFFIVLPAGWSFWMASRTIKEDLNTINRKKNGLGNIRIPDMSHPIAKR